MTGLTPDAALRDDLDAQGFGYWPKEAQEAILRRDDLIALLLDDVLVLMDQHTSAEVKMEARLRIIERHGEQKS